MKWRVEKDGDFRKPWRVISPSGINVKGYHSQPKAFAYALHRSRWKTGFTLKSGELE